MKKILFIILSLILWIGCYDEDPLTPTTEPEPYFLLPQGDHDFDRNIVISTTRYLLEFNSMG